MGTRDKDGQTSGRLLKMDVQELFRQYPTQVTLFYLGFTALVFTVLWLVSSPGEIGAVVAASLLFGLVLNALILTVKALRSRKQK